MKLFDPLTIRGMELKNRIVMPAMKLGMGVTNQRATAFFVERARGGVGAIIVGALVPDVFVCDDAWGRPGAAASFVARLRPFTQAIHQAGAKVGVQLSYHNRYPYSMGDISGVPVAPSARIGKVDYRGTVGSMRALTAEEIQTFFLRIAQAATKAKEVGFDFVEIHGAHGYLLCQFFSPAYNLRKDKYGGNLAKRMRFGIECAKAVRLAVGDDYPIFFRLGAWEDKPGGVTLEESSQYAPELEKAGVDTFNISLASLIDYSVTTIPVCPSKKERMGTFVWLAEAIKQKVGVPVLAVGRINSPKVAEAIIAQGKADLVGIARQLIADPFWPNKVAQGRVKEIVPCQSCNEKCFGYERGEEFGCKVNEWAGREVEMSVPDGLTA